MVRNSVPATAAQGWGNTMKTQRSWKAPIWKAPIFIAGVAVIVVSCEAPEQADVVQQEQQEEANPVGAPTFEYDPSWPKPLPNNWALGEVWGVAVDSHDNPWILHGYSTRVQGMLEQEGRELAPPVVQFDPEGNVLQAWGGPGEGYDWMPRRFGSEHGMFIDHEDNVWLVGGGSGDFAGGVVLKFTATGEFLLQIGEDGATNGSDDRRLLGFPTTAAVDSDTNEVYVADGYINQRVVVFDAVTGEYKRHWGAYGRPPDDGPAEPLTPDGPAPQRWNATHCVRIANDGLVYVCDRSHNRVHVFETDGTFLEEVFLDRATPAPWSFDVEANHYVARTEPGNGTGSASMVAFSHDPEQRYLYVGSASSYRKIYIMERRTLQLVGEVDTRGGHHEMSVDSNGRIYTVDGFSRWPERYLYRASS